MAERVDYSTELPKNADVVIIGGGVVGAATAFYVARAGFSCALLEKRGAPCTLTTPASTGAFRLQFDNREEMELARESLELFLHFHEITGSNQYDLNVRQQGYLWVTTSDAGVERQRTFVTQQISWGQTDVELLNGDEAQYRFPFLSPAIRQARFRQGDGFLDPKALTMGLIASSGAAVLVDCPATGFAIHKDRVVGVETRLGRIQSNQVVIAAGPFSGQVAALAGLSFPLQAVRRQKLVMPTLPQVPSWAPMTIDEDTGAHWRPGLHGAYLLFTDPTTPPEPPLEDVPTDHTFYTQLMDPRSPVSVSRIVPFWESVWEANTDYWVLHAGQYTMTPDHRPLIGMTSMQGLYLNTGYSGHGIMAGPAGSRRLVDLLTGESDPDENPFRVDRSFEARKLDVL